MPQPTPERQPARADDASCVTTHPLKPDSGRPVVNEKIDPASCVSPWATCWASFRKEAMKLSSAARTRSGLPSSQPARLAACDPDLASYLRIEERRTRKGDETSADSYENLGTQSSQFYPLEWPFPAATHLSGAPPSDRRAGTGGRRVSLAHVRGSPDGTGCISWLRSMSALVVSDAVEDFTSSSIVSPDLAQQRVRSDSLS